VDCSDDRSVFVENSKETLGAISSPCQCIFLIDSATLTQSFPECFANFHRQFSLSNVFGFFPEFNFCSS
jgi:hypothetical protein